MNKISTMILTLFIIFYMPGAFAGEAPLKWKYPINKVSSVSVSEDGNVAAGSDNWLYMLDRNGELLWKKYIGVPVERVSISKNGRYVAVGSRGTVKLFDRDGKSLYDFNVWKWASAPFSIHSIQVYSRNNIFVTGSISITSPTGEKYFNDSVGNLFFLDRGKTFDLGAYKVADEVFDSSVSEDLKYMAVAGSEGDSLGVYFLRRNEKEGEGKEPWYFRIWEENKNGSYYLHKKKITKWKYDVKSSKISAVRISPGGRYTAVGYANRVDFLDQNGNKIWSHNVGDGMFDLFVSGDGSYVAVASRDKNVHFLDRDGKLLWKYKTGHFVKGVSGSSDGRYVAAASLDNNVYFFDNEPEKPKVVILSNSIDYARALDFVEFLENNGMEVIRASATDFDQYKNERFIVILGGPDAPEGVGEIVQRVLTGDEQDYLREKGNRKM